MAEVALKAFADLRCLSACRLVVNNNERLYSTYPSLREHLYTHIDEHGTAQNFYIVPTSTHRQTYRQTDSLQCPRILISSHGDYPMLVKMRVFEKDYTWLIG